MCRLIVCYLVCWRCCKSGKYSWSYVWSSFWRYFKTPFEVTLKLLLKLVWSCFWSCCFWVIYWLLWLIRMTKDYELLFSKKQWSLAVLNSYLNKNVFKNCRRRSINFVRLFLQFTAAVTFQYKMKCTVHMKPERKGMRLLVKQ